MSGLLQDVRIVSSQDVVWLFRRVKKTLVYLGGLGAVIAMLFTCYRGVSYTVEASFKEQVDSNDPEGRNMVKQLFFSLPSSSMQTQSLMTSYAVLRSVIESLGLQVKFYGDNWLQRGFSCFVDVCRAEGGFPVADVEAFRCSDVVYLGESPLDLTCSFIRPDEFVLFFEKQEIGRGTVGLPLSLRVAEGFLQFILQEVPETLCMDKTYRIRILPWLSVASLLRKQLTISPHKTNSLIYTLTYQTRDRVEGVKVINALMAELQDYLLREHQLFAKEQIDYLAHRQRELLSQFETTLKDRAVYLSQYVGNEGCLEAAQQLQLFLDPYLKLKEHSLAIDFELQRLQNGCLNLEDSPLSHYLHTMQSQLQTLQQQKDVLEVSIAKFPLHEIPDQTLQIDALSQELTCLREKKEEMQSCLDHLQEGFTSLFDPALAVNVWAKHLQGTSQESRKDVQEYLSRWIKLLSMREKIVSQRFLQKELTASPSEAMDWETAKNLCKEYVHQLDQSEAQIRSLSYVLEQLQSEHTEPGSLAAALKDPISQHLIDSASALYRQLKEDKYGSNKEILRWQEDLALQRHLLKEHVEQTIEVEKIHAALLRDQLAILQQTSLDGIHRHMLVIEQNIQEEIAKRQTELVREKELISEQMKSLHDQLALLPKTWQAEQLFALQSKANQTLMETVVQLVETKTIGHHLHQMCSKPIDQAVMPILPRFPYFFLSLLLGILASSGSYFFTRLIQGAKRGFPMNREKLRILGLPCSGEISHSFLNRQTSMQDLDTLRHVCLFINAPSSAQIIGLVGAKGAEIVLTLAQLMVQRDLKTCIVYTDFSKTENQEPGLLQVLEGTIDDLPLHSLEGVDYLSSGGYSPFGPEKLQSQFLLEILDQLKSRYDVLFLCQSSSLERAESQALLKLCDKIVVSLQEEAIDLLTPFISWAYDEKYRRLTFITSVLQ